MKRLFRAAAALSLLLAALPARAAEIRASVLFIGDIMVHEQQLRAARQKSSDGTVTWNFSPQFRRISPLFQDQFTVGNLETVLAGSKRGWSGYPRFNTPDSLADALLNDLGVDLLTLSTNHIFDCGARGARRTTQILDKTGILWTGLALDRTPRNDAVLCESDGLLWAFVNFGYGSNAFVKSSDVHMNVISEKSIAEGMRNAAVFHPDVTVACFHWGTEYTYRAGAQQRKAAEKALELGADLVIGTHPHVVQPVEVCFDKRTKRTGAVAWSLGNFISFQRTLPRERSYILKAEFAKDDEGHTRLIRLSAAPLQVILTPVRGARLAEVVYAGKDGSFNHAGLSRTQLKNIRAAGDAVLDFLGAQTEPDEKGFYTLWSAENPQKLPKPRRRTPVK